MPEIELNELLAAIPVPEHQPRAPARSLDFVIASAPQPFVAPTLRVPASNGRDHFSGEVVFIEASAAVGKTTLVNHISASRKIPLLDLSKVHVSTGTLQALIAGLSGPGDPVHAFHTGALPIIIDALDEGRLHSQETGFDSFLQTAAEFLQEDRSATDSPKLIIVGRYQSVDIAKEWFELAGPEISTRSAEIGFFGENAAWELIRAYAESTAKSDAAYWDHPDPVRELIQAYFNAIAVSLGIDRAALWTTDRGRAFAGYAPVLAAIGGLLANMRDFIGLANQLRSAGTQEAWGVIETVLNQVLSREQNQLRDQLAEKISGQVPDEVYDADEQLALLTQYVHHEPLVGSGRVQLAPTDHTKYHSMIEQKLPDHPFVRHGDFGNAVLGSVALAYAVIHDLLRESNLEKLENFSQQPFIWRSVRRLLTEPGELVDGKYLGCILNSFWNDPIEKDTIVMIRSLNDDGSATVQIGGDGGELSFEVLPPVTLYGQIRNCEVDICDTVKLKGHASRDSASVFYTYGTTTIICDVLARITQMIM